MDPSDGEDMGTRLVRLIAAAAVLLGLARLTRLIQPSLEGPPWQVVVVVAAILGGLLTWAVRAARLGPFVAALVHGLGLALLVTRLAVPETLMGGVVPGPGSLEALAAQMSDTGQILRFGAAPVFPVPGLLALLATLSWLLGAAAASARPLVGAVASLVLYLQYATLDRRPPGPWWTVGFVAIACLVLVGMIPRRSGPVGRVRVDDHIVARRSAGLTLGTLLVAATVAVGSSAAMAATVPESGVLAWRTRSGIGAGLYGGGSFNLFVGLQQSLVDLSDEPMFLARVSSSAPPNRELYWKLITLDTFDGENWLPGEQTFAQGGRARWERDDWVFQGPTVRVAANVRIASYTGQFLPTLYSPVGLQSEERLLDRSFRIREDGSIATDVQAAEGWMYQIEAEVPQPDMSILASDDGRLSPLFQAAADAGAVALEPVDTGAVEPEPESLDAYTDLPPSVTEDVTILARDITRGATTDFERALLLEAFLRDSSLFTYSTEVSTGHSSLDLADWLTDPDSRNYRTGYCEQFATAMAVMGRAIGVPSRVVLGFTPGTVETQSDGSEVIVVRERNAHAWVETWMPEQGWVRFDPTPRADGVNPSVGSEIGEAEQPFDARQFVPDPGNVAGTGGNAQIPVEDLRPPGEVNSGGELTGGAGDGFRLPGWSWWLVAALGLVGLLPVAKLVRRRRRLSRLSDGDVAAAWAEIVDRLSDLGTPADPAETPLEIARSEDPSLEPLARLYTAAAYGGRSTAACTDEFTRAEESLKRRYAGRRWLVSWISPESLRRRSSGGAPR
jgi:transglutaminase-like putative cysteine protease